jgi:hypothetical protein
MKIINHSILGSGFSALIKDQLSLNSTIFAENEKKIRKSGKFYEITGIGGNTNVWGGYINYERFKILLKNKKFKQFFDKNKLFKIKKISNINNNHTCYLSEYNKKKIFRIKKKNFRNKILNEKINKISIEDNHIKLFGNKEYRTKYLSLCIGNLSLLELLYNSKIIKNNDLVTFRDSECGYSLNLFLDHKNFYYIPMKVSDIILKLIFKKVTNYNSNIKYPLIFQKFKKKNTIFKFKLEEIFKFKSLYPRFFLSNHIADIRINNFSLEKFIKKKSKNIKIYNSGVCKKYVAGPISQELINNVLAK